MNNLNIKKLISASILSCYVLFNYAQQLPVVTQYIYNPYLYNPAFAGKNGNNMANVWVSHKRQWINMPNAPVSTIATVDVRIPKTGIGLGLNMYNDRAHILNNSGGQLAVAYHQRLNKKNDMFLSAALSFGLIYQQINFAAANAEDIFDPVVQTKSPYTTAFDMSAGINFNWRGLNVGASFPQIINNKVGYKNTNDKVKFTLARHYLIRAGYKFPIKKFSLEPNVMLRLVDNIAPQVDLHLLAGWNNIIFLGAGYRSSNDVTSTAGVNATILGRVKNLVSIGYTFETGVSSYDMKNFGTSHEVIVGFHFNSKSKKDDKKIKQFDDLANKLDSLNKALSNKENEAKELNNAYEKLKVENDINIAQIKALLEANKALEDADEGDIIIIGPNGEKSIKKKNEEDDGDIIIIGPNGEKKNIKKGDTYFSTLFKKIGEIYFTKNSSVLQVNAKSNLDAMVEMLNTKKDFVLFLGGNASEEGTNDYNLWLSDKRADKTMEYLVSKGIPKDRLIVLSSGERYATIKDESQKNLDRKVDFYLYEK